MMLKLLLFSRRLLIIPVIGSLLMAVGVVFMGAGLIFERSFHLLKNGEISLKATKMMSMTVIQTLDFFLVGALAYITAVGIYNLFLSDREEQILKRIKIEKLKDLEDKIIGVVVAALAVAYLGTVSEGASMSDVFYAGVGTALMIASLCLFIYFTDKQEK